eukprot:TRINITY_DN8269_c0_g1_i5.p1 TRINITY_DN8269_c0_g1~~TRINITY_DN8269_c0_g1_i5.p1  ORF type:complete len:1542 (+),score=155.75 TRINITY_DN8269_c0_g1_i5:66-4691(+)
MWLFLWFCFLTESLAVVPQVISAEYTPKTYVVQGREYHYTTFEIEWDQDVFFAENWACPCIHGNETFVHLQTAVDEADYEITTLERKSFSRKQITESAGAFFKFEIKEEDFPSGPPALRVLVDTSIANVLVTASTERIPTTSSYNWTKLQSNTATLGICPTSLGYGYGWFYVFISTDDDLAEFTISWDVVDTPLCANTPETPEELLPSPDADWTLLENNKPWIGPVANDAWKKFRFIFYERCSNFSWSTRNAYPQVGDMDLYFSFTTPELDLANGYSASADNGEDTMTLMNICSPTGAVPWHVYLSGHLWRGDQVQTVITATTDTGFVTRPMTSLSTNQYFHSFTAGYATLTCGSQQYKCGWSSYLGNLEPFDIGWSCGRWGFLSPTPDPEPWRTPLYRVFTFKPFDQRLPWDDDEVFRSEHNLPNRMAFYLLEQITGANTSRVFHHGEPEKCRVTLSEKFVNSEGENIRPQIMGFTEKKPTCDNAEIKKIRSQFTEYLEVMTQQETFEKVMFYQLKISILMNKKEVLGCKHLLDDLWVTVEKEISMINRECNSNEFTPGYLEDECCIGNLGWQSCCVENVIVKQNLVSSLADGALNTCHTDRCPDISLANYQTAMVNVVDERYGCNAAWTKTASEASFSAQKIFWECAVKLWGPFDMTGIPCKTDNDCYFGAACDLVHETCVHDQFHFLACISSPGAAVTGQLLMNLWNAGELLDTETFVNEVTKRFSKPMCTGPDSTVYRPHYDYIPVGDNICSDPCTDQNIVISCLSTDPTHCPKDDICKPFDFVWCDRQFIYKNETLNDACLEEKKCNWMSCGSLNQENCREACLADTTPMCLDCTTTPCTLLTGWDETRCSIGLCVGHPNILDHELCHIEHGECSLPCPNCTQSECEDLRMCQMNDFNLILKNEAHLTDGGACFSRPYVDVFGAINCKSQKHYAYGCFEPDLRTEISCTSAHHKWIPSTLSNLECEASSYQGCMSAGGYYNAKDEIECKCSGETWQSYFKVERGNYTIGRVRPLVWSPPLWESVRQVEMVLDLPRLYDEVSKVVTSYASLEYAKEGLCRVTPLLDILSTVSCDCNSGGVGESCYTVTNEGSLVDYMWASPFIANFHETRYFTLEIDKLSFPEGYPSRVITISLLSLNLFTTQATDARLSSRVFVESPENTYTILYYQRLVIEGQIITNGIKVDWFVEGTIGEPMTLCIPFENISKSEYFSDYAMGRVIRDSTNEGLIIERFNGSIGVMERNFVCANITEPGEYIGLYVRDAESIYSSLLAQSIVSAIIYFILLFCITYQIICIIKLKPVRFAQKLLFSSIAFLFLLIRSVYFVVYPIGIIEDEPIASYFVFEFPTFLFLIMNSTLIYLWLEISETMKNLKQVSGTGVNSRLFAAWVVWNLFILLCSCGFIIAYYASPSGHDPLSCNLYFAEQPSQAKLDVSLAYVIFVAVLSIVMAITFICIGMNFLLPIMLHVKSAQKGSHTQKNSYDLYMVCNVYICRLFRSKICAFIDCCHSKHIHYSCYSICTFRTNTYSWYVEIEVRESGG